MDGDSLNDGTVVHHKNGDRKPGRKTTQKHERITPRGIVKKQASFMLGDFSANYEFSNIRVQ